MATMRWIPTSERLPKTVGVYLVYAKNFGVVLAHWYGDQFGVCRASTNVTHWMPLPEPPKSPKQQKPITNEAKNALYKMGQQTHPTEVIE